MKTSKFFLTWVYSFVAVFVIDFIWHKLLFANTYLSVGGVAGIRISEGKFDPLMMYIIIAEILISFGSVYFLSGSQSTIRDGIIYSVVAVGFLGLINHAILLNWELGVVGLDLIFSLIVGVAVGWIVGWMKRSA